MISPYNNGGGAPSFGPPGGLAGIMAGREHNQALARQGASQNISTIMGYIMQGVQEKKVAEEAAKQRAGDFKALVEYGDRFGIVPKDEALVMDYDSLKGRIEGTVAKNKLQQAMEEFTLKKKELESVLSARKREGQQDATLQAALKAATTREVQLPIAPALIPSTTPPTARVNVPFNEQRLRDALAQGGGGGREGLRFLMEGDNIPVAAKVGGRDLIVEKSGASRDVTPQPAPKIPPGMEAISATVDENGRLQIHYGFPKAEGKALTQTEVGGIAALNQAEMDLNTLENIYKGLGPGYGGPISGRAKSFVMGGQNANIASLENAITAATPNLARGVFREVGVLTDQDVERYKKLLPAPTDTEEVRTRKIKQLRDRIAQGRKEMVTSLKAAGRDVEGFSAEGSKSAAPTRFDSEDAARAAGVGANVFELYDPATATYRKARLK